MKLLRLSPSVRTIYFVGNFPLSKPVYIESYANQTTWTSALGKRAIFTSIGGNKDGFVVKGANGVTVSDLTFRGFRSNAILVEGGLSATVARNTVLETLSSGWSQAGIHLRGAATGSKILQNTVVGSDYAGILVDTYGPANISGLRIARNQVLSSCRRITDCGAIYVNDRARVSRNISIEENHVLDFGPSGSKSRGIYLDDWASYVTVRNNKVSGPGGYAFQIHGGSYNLVIGNKIDLDGIDTLLLYQRISEPHSGPMAGNRFTRNVIFRRKASGSTFSTHPKDLGPEGMPIIVDNLFCSANKPCLRR